MKIYVKFKVTDSLEDFIKNLYGNPYNCIKYNYYRSVTTYSNPECTEIQCYANKYRSFDEVLMCVNTYFPDVTPKELMKVLIKGIPIDTEIGHAYLIPLNCCDIYKPTFYFNENYPADYDDFEEEDDEFKERCNSEFSWKDLCEEIGITNEETFNKKVEYYRKKCLKNKIKNESITVKNKTCVLNKLKTK